MTEETPLKGVRDPSTPLTATEVHARQINEPVPLTEGPVMMNEYQHCAVSLAVYPGQGYFAGLSYCALKLNGEAGEVAENVGKAMRDDHMYYLDKASHLRPDRRQKLLLELGDVLWYVAAAAKELGYTLDDVARANMDKLHSRSRRGTLQGSGDDR